MSTSVDRQYNMVVNCMILESNILSMNLSSTTYQLCDVEQNIILYVVKLPHLQNWDNIQIFLVGWCWRLNALFLTKHLEDSGTEWVLNNINNCTDFCSTWWHNKGTSKLNMMCKEVINLKFFCCRYHLQARKTFRNQAWKNKFF